jgi:hypothetical protein
MGITSWIKKHPAWSGAISFVVLAGATAESWWALFSDKPLVPEVLRWYREEAVGMTLPPLSLAHILTIAVLLLSFGMLAYTVWIARTSSRHAPTKPKRGDPDPLQDRPVGELEGVNAERHGAEAAEDKLKEWWVAIHKAEYFRAIRTGETALDLSFGLALQYEPEYIEMRQYLGKDTIQAIESRYLAENWSHLTTRTKRLLTRDLRLVARKWGVTLSDADTAAHPPAPDGRQGLER